MESDEDPLQAAVREVAEKTGITDLAFRWAWIAGKSRLTPTARWRASTSPKRGKRRCNCPSTPDSAAPNITNTAGRASRRHGPCCRRDWRKSWSGCGPPSILATRQPGLSAPPPRLAPTQSAVSRFL
ncbi:MAG: hypothetical protein ACOY4L_09365 [Pseudomonadota bacterium]